MDTRIAAFDIGDKRVGVAYSDPFLSYATPSETYFRTGDLARDTEALASLAERQGVTLIVCGLPLNADGTRSIQTEKTERFVAELRERTKIAVVFEDERYTTREARRDLVAMGVSARKDKGKKAIDSVAACYILEGYLAKLKKERQNMDYKEEENNYEEEDNLVELVDEEGVKTTYEHLLTFEYKGEWYVALTPYVEGEEVEEEEESDEGDEVAIYHIVGEEDNESLEAIEDEAFLDEVFAEFCNQYEDFEDEDEAAALDGAE